MSYRQILYHIIFTTKYRRSTIPEEHCQALYKYIWGVIKNKKCTLYQINGVENHIHIFSDLHPSVCLANLIKDIKISSNLWMKQTGLFPLFEAWQEGYGAFTYSIKDKEKIVNYIKKQKEHHKHEGLEEEYKRLLLEHKIDFDERFLL